ncbi:ABC transporter permease [Gracilimonas tropica]|uniref:ABC transporter permease n=1 Tax=Gracilimonas tropica TaxID=454600 RepID=UPI0003626428|nr:ABC transporter permease [Gracilimonas tropica]
MPKIISILKILERFVPDELHHLLGDLEEEYQLNIKREGVTRARFIFWSQILRSLPWFILQSLIWNTEMLFNYLKVTWRNLKKHTSFSFINIFGLAASMSVCLLIILFLVDQTSYDDFSKNSDRIVRIIMDFKSPYNDDSNLYATTPASLGGILEENYPEVEQAVQVRGGFNGEFRHGETVLPLEGMYADSSFLPIFGFTLIEGNPKTALSDPGSILLTPESAYKIFGDEEALGKTITALGDQDYTVTGIIDNDVRTHFRFESIASYSTLTADTKSQSLLQNWKNSTYDSYTYLLMKKDADLQEFQSKIQSVISTNYADPSGENQLKKFQVQPLTEINLGPALSNEVGMVMPGFIAWFLVGFAIIVTLIAVFNYVSLTIARSLNRGREVGVRKVLGAHRGSIVQQFLFESVLIAFSSLVFATIILRWLLPEFNSLFFISFTQNQVEPNLLTNPETILAFLAFTLIVGIVAGFYPSLYLSSFSPARVLKGIFNVKGLSGQTLKKIITVSQFTFSLIFIITSFILFQQFKFMANTDYGFNRENIVNIALQDVSFNRLKYNLEKNPNVASVAASSKIPAIGSIDGVWIKSDSIDKKINAHSFRVDENYIQTMGLNLISGRNFNPETGTDTSKAVIISDQAALQLGFNTPAEALGKQITVDDKPLDVVGVIENFISADPLRSGDPIVMLYQPEKTDYAVVKILPGQTPDFLAGLNKTWLSFDSIYSLKYKIMNEQLEDNPQMIVFIDFIKILGLIAAFSILISCLGLLGMAMYSAENRVKEIGIRKVLGASVQNIVLLLSREYIVLIGISFLIGLPLSWFINNLWMEQVTNKVGLHAGVFITGALMILFLALLTIGSQALKAAKTNPVSNLRSE